MVLVLHHSEQFLTDKYFRLLEQFIFNKNDNNLIISLTFLGLEKSQH